MYCVVQIGSRMFRLECGTTRSTLSWAAAGKRAKNARSASRRMRKSPREKTRRRVAQGTHGHGTHRNRRLPARDQHLRAIEGRLCGLRSGRRMAGRAIRRAALRRGRGRQHSLRGRHRRAAPLGRFGGLDCLPGLPSQCSFTEPCRSIYRELEAIEQREGVTLSFTPGFPMADFAECGMAVFGYGANAKSAIERLHRIVADAEPRFALELHAAADGVRRAKSRGEVGAPVVLAD